MLLRIYMQIIIMFLVNVLESSNKDTDRIQREWMNNIIHVLS